MTDRSAPSGAEGRPARSAAKASSKTTGDLIDTLLAPGLQKDFLKKLLSWYEKNGRHDMPWRITRDPYAVFVSEFMLQQTTVATVRPYYDRFLKRFPTISSLAAADLNDVLALWSGLGYYARARNLWQAMRIIVDTFQNVIPSDPEKLEELPGVGAYTAGAIAAFAFDRPSAVVDGNIIRVLMRVLGIEDDPKLRAVQVIIKKLSLDLAHLAEESRGRKKKGGPRDLQLGLMDLGATLCAPQNPDCGACPAATFCQARKFGRQNEIPLKGEKAERPTVRRLYAVISDRSSFLMGHRPKEGLFGGLWEFIGADTPTGIEPVLFLEEMVQREAGLKVRVREALPAFEHQLSHRVFLVRSFVCDVVRKSGGRLKSKGTQYEKIAWVSPRRLTRLGLSAITKKIMAEFKGSMG